MRRRRAAQGVKTGPIFRGFSDGNPSMNKSFKADFGLTKTEDLIK